MPFGLCNAPATFERLMELVLTGLIGDACLVYLDDIIIVGRTFEEHLQNLECVLMKIRRANLKLSPKKCSLFKRQVSHLRYVVSEEGIRTDPEKIARRTPKIVHVDRLARYYGANNARDEHVLGGGSVARHY
ncbi:unnamed protein product [Parnassius mnemosyne]|uniref:Reverse transcriptase domain-containing protein n=1 Tax=Parnassius mnemosyne TaxID=213953 RepID=A0AAV1LMH0_9NEOP